MLCPQHHLGGIDPFADRLMYRDGDLLRFDQSDLRSRLTEASLPLFSHPCCIGPSASDTDGPPTWHDIKRQLCPKLAQDLVLVVVRSRSNRADSWWLIRGLGGKWA